MIHATPDKRLIRKYNVPGPRYTSYPTVPYWEQSPSVEQWADRVKSRFDATNASEGVSLYIHLPYCESLCTFCACHKHISKSHHVEVPYINTVLKEWQLYTEMLDARPRISEIHLGGGTPTFFSPDSLERLISGIFERADRSHAFEFSFEGHPNNTTKAHLQTLFDLGFRRNSFGVQDYDPVVQQTINRIQPFEHVERVTEWSREIGYTSISHDLVFGLPHQSADCVEATIRKTRQLQPDRIAFYSYAHVPWIKGVAQRGFDESDLPKDEAKRQLYELGKTLFAEMDYHEIGMDHFALEGDSLFQAMQQQKLHRNFMGYTHSKTGLMIGLGMSSISDSWDCFAQNIKQVREYTIAVENGQIPIFRGHLLDDEDLKVRQVVLDTMCQFEADLRPLQDSLPGTLERLSPLADDGLLTLSDGYLLKVTDVGKAFVRNICMCFDLKMLRNKPDQQVFSKTV